MKEQLEKWMIENHLDFQWLEDDVVLWIAGVEGKFFVLNSGDESVFDEEFSLNLDIMSTDRDELLDEDIKYTIYKFGDMFYYTSNEPEIAQMIPFQAVGKAFLEMSDDYTHLGIHGHRELLNGSGQYEDYAKKAKFFGYKAIGIAEKNTLAGAMIFQNACKKYGVKPIFGMTIDVLVDGEKKEAKVYAKNEEGWRNLLNMANIINNENHVEKVISEQEIFGLCDGVFFVFAKNWIPSRQTLKVYGESIEEMYYQLDTTEYSYDALDVSFLEHTKEYVDEYGFDGELKPILISDSYYNNQSEHMSKKILNQIDIGASYLQSKEQFFRPVEYHYDKMSPLFRSDEKDFFEDIFFDAVENTMKIAVRADFEINTDFLNMPIYELDEKEKEIYTDKYELYNSIIDSNWSSRVPEGMDDEYEARLEEEFRVIDGNGFLDYFLINWDWIEKCCKAQNIYTGVARGSAGGSVLSYLLGVTNIDPIKYDLLFERFLNEGRLKKTIKTKYIDVFFDDIKLSFKEDKLLRIVRDNNIIYINASKLENGDVFSGNNIVSKIQEIVKEVVTAGSPPDIDSDVESSGRQEVKEYLERRYGKNRVFSIGTFTSLGIKSGISDVARQKGVDVKLVKTITKMVTQKEITAGFGYSDFFVKAQSNKPVKQFIMDYPEVMELVRVVMGNSKSPSVHAAGVIITPKFDSDGNEMNAWDWVPVKEHDGQMISEWEGGHLEQAGMLKLDLLGTTILDKIHAVISSIKKVEGIDVGFEDIYSNKLEDGAAFDVFTDGFTQNVFQFSGGKMTKFIQSMEPTTIDDIYAANALFRPATMNLGYHEDYVEMKHGRKDVVYDWGLEEITRETYGILIFQEQLLQAVKKLGGFSLAEADDLRKAMGKKKQDLMDSYKGKFLEGAIGQGCDELEAIKIWNKIEQGASYGFNKCISGNESIYRVGLNRDMFNPTIGEMYKIRNDLSYAKSIGKTPLRSKYLGSGYGHGFSLNNEGKLIKNKIVDIRFEGVRETFKISLSNGMSINTTDNHKFPTSNGEKLLMNLEVGKDMLYVNDGYFQEDTEYRYTDKGLENKYHSSEFIGRFKQNSLKGVEGFVEKGDTSWKNHKYYLNNIKEDFCEICGAKDCRLEAHHIDGNHGNNDLNNLQTVCVSCHKKEHYKMGRTKMGEKGLHTNLVHIESIKSNGFEEVYDVEMAAPHHTFATQGGVVTCNSHAAAYGLESYVTAYLKAHYPVHFYTMSLEFSNDDDRPLIISEINDDGRITIAAPNVNTSSDTFITDFANKKIYWALSSIKFVGDVATKNIVKIREEGGDYVSLEDFLERTKGHKVNKTTVVNLILSGAFDEIEKISSSVGRFGLINRFYSEWLSEKVPEDKFPREQILKPFFWNRLQTSLSGLGTIDYRSVYASSGFKEKYKSLTFLSADDFHKESKIGKFVGFASTLADIRVLEVRATGAKFAKLTLQCNDKMFSCVVWMEQWEMWGDILNKAKGSIIVINGKIDSDSYAGGNQLMSHKKTEFRIL